MSYIKRLYGSKASIFIGLSNLLVVICSCSGGLVYIDDKTFTNNYLEGDVVYTDNHTATKFIHCVSVCIKECMQPCPLISFTDGICRCHSSYAHINKGQYAPNRDKTMYFRIANKNDGVQEKVQNTYGISGVIPRTDVLTTSTRLECTSKFMEDCNEREKETANVSTTANPSISESSSLKQEASEYSSFITDIMCTNTPSTADSSQIVLDGDYYIKVFNTLLNVTFDSFAHNVYLTLSNGAKFNFKHQVDGSYLIYAKNNMTTNYSLNVNGSSSYAELSDSSSPVNHTYFFLEYQPEGAFRIKVKSLDYYIAKSGLFLSLTNETYGDNGKFLIGTASPAWDIIFRIRTGSPYNIYEAFLYGTKQLMTNSCEVNTNGTCKYSFTRQDGILRDWWNGCLSVRKIKYSLMKNNTEVLAFVFNGVNASPETWFVATKLQWCNYYPNITDLSLTAVQSGVWYLMVTDKRLKINISAAYYENQTDPSSPNRKLSVVVFGNRMPEAEVHISVTTK